MDALGRGGTHRLQDGWRLEGHERFRPSLGGLLSWAVDRGLFRDWLEQGWQRARWGTISVDLGRNPPHRWTPIEYDTWPDEERERWWDTQGRARWERDRLEAISGFRNILAHPTSHNVVTPVDGIRAVDDLADFINVLWPGDESAPLTQ